VAEPGAPAMTTTPADASTPELISRLSEQSSRLVRDELRLAQAELLEKAKSLGRGAGMFGAAGLVAFFGIATMLTTVILALALAVDAWLAALIVTVVLLGIAGVLIVVARRQVSRGLPATPQKSIESVKQDVETVKESAHRDSH
jgi:uncharacterized membrane protein YqjE